MLFFCNFSLNIRTFSFASSLPVLFSIYSLVFCFFFFFQAEDGIRDWSVTGVQTCALPICRDSVRARGVAHPQDVGGRLNERIRAGAHGCRAGVVGAPLEDHLTAGLPNEIGRASCRERV